MGRYFVFSWDTYARLRVYIFRSQLTPPPPHMGEYVHLARVDLASPPGRLRIFLPDLESVRKLRAAFHGQSVQVGSDLVGFRITNDRLDAEGLPGGATRQRS